MKRLFLVDAYALIYKYYYAFMGRPMRNRNGLNTSIIYGFTAFLRDIQRREKPDLLGVAFDPAGGSFRRTLSPEYKANRPPTPEDIKLSVPYVKRIVEAMCIPILEVAGFEADDVIGTLAMKGAAAGYDVYMVTPDKDYGQLVRDHCKIYKQRGDVIEIVDCEAIRAKYGIERPELVSDILALWGDASDNIIGVAGIGEKGAAKLVAEWGDTEQIIANADRIKGRQGENIRASVDTLRLAKELATIRLDVPIDFDEAALTVCCPRVDELRALFAELDFKGFLADLRNVAPVEEPGPKQAPQVQLANIARQKAGERQRLQQQQQGSLFDGFDMETAVTPTAVVTETEAVVEELPTADNVEEVTVEQPFATLVTTQHNYRRVNNAAELQTMVETIAKYDEFCFDIESTGFNIFSDRIIGIAFAVEPHSAWYVPFDYAEQSLSRAALEQQYAEILRPLFESDTIAKVGQNIKFDILFMRRLGIDVRGRKYDTMIMHYLLDSEARHNMNFLAERYLHYSPQPIEELIGKGPKQLTMDMVATERVAEYAGEDADITLQLRRVLWEELQRESMCKLYLEVEEPMIDVLADMEYRGVRINSEALQEYSQRLTADMEVLERSIREATDEPTLNINSARQLGEVLFGKMRLAEKPKRTKSGQFSTDEEYLTEFASKSDVVRQVLEYRTLKKLLSTYVDALPLLVEPTTGRIHTSYNQAVTATGRLSSTNPNLQNIPIRDAIGRPIREAFIPAEGMLLMSADYSQVELRVMAHLSGDKALCDAFLADEDIHSATAAKIFKRPIDEVTQEERRRAKTANFGIIYGISVFGLSQRLSIPRAEAKELIEGYFASYPDVKRYMDESIATARERGFCTTIFGRRRYLADIASRNATVRGLAERNAINAPIQGSAADIMKLAMVRIAKAMHEERLGSAMIMQVHDEVVLEVVPAERERVEQLVREAMEQAVSMRIPLKADCGVGANWLEAH